MHSLNEKISSSGGKPGNLLEVIAVASYPLKMCRATLYQVPETVRVAGGRLVPVASMPASANKSGTPARTGPWRQAHAPVRNHCQLKAQRGTPK
jgi:hypothetical protein